MPKQNDALKAKIRELQLRRLRSSEGVVRRGNDYVPSKRSTKKSGKMQNTFDKNLRGVPGGSRARVVSELRQGAADRTGCIVREEGIGVLHSARNANTTSGSYIRSVVLEADGRVVSDAQGRKVFGR
jgi:hypothetical protein